jgi:peptidoglycan/xylan/chitin deacetylase (PgdA/CDA1 family)
MTLLHSHRFAGWARGHLLCRVEGVPDRFALTFDDGPSERTTPALLDKLASHGARATFFVLRPNVERLPAIARRALAEGHELAAHGDQHWPLPLLPPWAIRGEIRRCAAAITAATGVRPRLYRPPFGFMMPGQAWYVRRMGFEPVLGDVYPEDPHQPGVDRIIARVLPRLVAGSILILHDGSPLGEQDRSQTLEALDTILPHCRRLGMTAVTVSELLAAGPGDIAVVTPEVHTPNRWRVP